jgi:ADP-heptose:LPS heptosyltransferase
MLTNIPVHSKAPAASAILRDTGLIHGYLNYPVGTRSPFELTRLWWKIRAFQPDILIYLTKPRGEAAIRRDAKFFRLCGVKKIIGLPLGEYGNNLQVAGDRWESEAARLARSLRELAEIDVENLENWDLRLTPNEIATVSERYKQAMGDRPFLAMGIGTKAQAKDWGVERWSALTKRLAEVFPQHGLVFVGAKEDREASEVARNAWGGVSVNLCGALAPRETAAVLRNAELFLGPDSGPMHFAAAAGVPCAIAFAARTKPGIWYPVGMHHRVIYHRVACAGCNLDVCIEQQKQCLTSISVDEMLAAALEDWSDGQADRSSQAV